MNESYPHYRESSVSQEHEDDELDRLANLPGATYADARARLTGVRQQPQAADYEGRVMQPQDEHISAVSERRSDEQRQVNAAGIAVVRAAFGQTKAGAKVADERALQRARKERSQRKYS